MVVSLGLLLVFLAGCIQLLLGLDVMENDGKIDWDKVTIAFVLFGIALGGIVLDHRTLFRREE